MDRTRDATKTYGFALESQVLHSLYIVGLKCRDSRLRRRAVELLGNATVQEGLWSGKVFAAYLRRMIEIEEAQARRLRPDLPEEIELTYNLVPEEARMRDVVLATDDTRPLTGRLVWSQRSSEDQTTTTLLEDKFRLLSV